MNSIDYPVQGLNAGVRRSFRLCLEKQCRHTDPDFVEPTHFGDEVQKVFGV
jgi:hypothetical protein